jgi:hypothetical protein
MGFSLGDSTAATQRLAVSTGGAVELGSATPTASLSIMGRQLISGSTLTPFSVPSNGLNRITGSVTLQSELSTTVSVGPCAGLGIMPGAFLLSFTSTTFDAAFPSNTAGVFKTFQYSIL